MKAKASLAPGFLIAMPQLRDPNFHQSVVLMLEHAASGSMGLIVNQQAQVTLGELAKDQSLAVAPSRSLEHVFVGGPVEPYRGFVLHDSRADVEKAELLPGLFLSVTSHALEALLQDATASLRLCLGYAGWGAGQIDRELQEGSWLFTEAHAEAVLRLEPKQLWEHAIKSMGVDPAMLVISGGLN